MFYLLKYLVSPFYLTGTCNLCHTMQHHIPHPALFFHLAGYVIRPYGNPGTVEWDGKDDGGKAQDDGNDGKAQDDGNGNEDSCRPGACNICGCEDCTFADPLGVVSFIYNNKPEKRPVSCYSKRCGILPSSTIQHIAVMSFGGQPLNPVCATMKISPMFCFWRFQVSELELMYLLSAQVRY